MVSTFSMRSIAYLTLTFLLITLLSPDLGEAICYQTGQPGTKLPPYYDSNGTLSCRPGFLCREFDPENETTHPEACIPSAECSLKRQVGGALCEESQGLFEPELCPSGYYCPTNQGLIVECPPNTLCIKGSTEPKECPALSVCSAGRVSYFGPLLGWFIVTVLGVVLIFIYRKFGLTSEDPSSSSSRNDSRRNSQEKYTGGRGGGRLTPQPQQQDAAEPKNSSASIRSPTSPNGPSSPMMSSPTTNTVSEQQLVMGFKLARGEQKPIHLEFSNLAVSVTDKGTGKEKSILKDMSGFMEPGTVTAIMGPSGAGKTTFMMALLGKKDSAWNTKGKLLVNGEDKLSSLRHSIGFVPQDDILHKELSVYKNIYYSSETRLPSTWTSEEKTTFRGAVIESLGLKTHRDTKIGDEHTRGVSGGQRKRASIGVELAAAPLAMFLDEPTSGLDSTTSLEVCSTLKKIAVETDLTVGMVIHQPRIEIWNGLDQVLFIGKGGRVVYQGSQLKAQEYFEKKCSVNFPPESNPADVIIDVIDQNSDAFADMWKSNFISEESRANFENSGLAEMKEEEEELLSNQRTEEKKEPDEKQTKEVEGDVGGATVQRFDSQSGKVLLSETAETPEPNSPTPTGENESSKKEGMDSSAAQQEPSAGGKEAAKNGDQGDHIGFQGASFLKQVVLAHNRSMEKQIATPQSFFVEQFICFLTGAILGQAFRNFDYTGFFVYPYRAVTAYPLDALMPQMNMYSVMSIGLGAAPAGVRPFGSERLNYFREVAAGHNPLAYFLGTVFAQSYRCVYVTLLFSGCYQCVGGLPIPFGNFFAVMFLTYWNAYAIGMVISILIPMRMAPLVAQVSLICISVFNGFVSAFPDVLKKITFPYYASNVVMNQYYELYKDVYEPNWDPWGYEADQEAFSLGMMFLFASVFHIAAFLLLIGTNRDRQR